jgi:hypothetical protein
LTPCRSREGPGPTDRPWRARNERGLYALRQIAPTGEYGPLHSIGRVRLVSARSTRKAGPRDDGEVRGTKVAMGQGPEVAEAWRVCPTAVSPAAVRLVTSFSTASSSKLKVGAPIWKPGTYGDSVHPNIWRVGKGVMDYLMKHWAGGYMVYTGPRQDVGPGH